MAMEVSKGDILAGFQKLFGHIFIPALQQQEVRKFLPIHVIKCEINTSPCSTKSVSLIHVKIS